MKRPARGQRSIRHLYLAFYDLAFARPYLVLAALAVVAISSAWLVPRIRLDMSFRPLFGQSDEDLEAARGFEATFGQRSGAYIGAIITPDAWTPVLLERIAAATREASALEHVSEVVSLARFAVVDWTADGPVSRWLIDPNALDMVSEAELRAVLDLRDSAPLAGTLFSRELVGGQQAALSPSTAEPEERRTLLLARLDLPLDDLDNRARAIHAFEAAVSRSLEGVAGLKWIGISVVEEAYSRIVISGIGLSLGLTTLVLLVVLGAVFRRPGAVVVIMAGVCLALPVALAMMVVRGQAITMVNSMVPTMILIIGVADAIHMFECYSGRASRAVGRAESVRSMFGDMALPCLLTALTTAAGFLALEMARIAAIRDFGLNVAFGVGAVYVMNLFAVPALLAVLPERQVLAQRSSRGRLAAWQRMTTRILQRRPGLVIVASGALILACVAGVRRLDVDQRFNEDVAADHPVRVAQDIFERDFAGFLGPDVSVRRIDGSPVVQDGGAARLAAFGASLAALPGVNRVESVLDWMADGVPEGEAIEGLASLRTDARVGIRVREVIAADPSRTAVVVQLADVGSRAARDLVADIRAAAARDLGPEYEVEVVGQWWLAQLGLSSILRDMLVSFATSFLLVLPIVAIALGSVRLFAVGLIPNLLPMLFALGFMGWTGISARVGTAMILAIALAIAVDDTIHILVRLRESRAVERDPAAQVRSVIDHVGMPIVLTTVVLVAGFLSMRASGLLALQDMGVVAAATLTVALLADVYLLPASYVILERRFPANDGALATNSSGPPAHRDPVTTSIPTSDYA